MRLAFILECFHLHDISYRKIFEFVHKMPELMVGKGAFVFPDAVEILGGSQ